MVFDSIHTIFNIEEGSPELILSANNAVIFWFATPISFPDSVLLITFSRAVKKKKKIEHRRPLYHQYSPKEFCRVRNLGKSFPIFLWRFALYFSFYPTVNLPVGQLPFHCNWLSKNVGKRVATAPPQHSEKSAYNFWLLKNLTSNGLSLNQKP